MPDATTDENYKGIFQEYCHARNLGDPVYESIPHGSPNEPSWNVTIRYGQSAYVTPNLVRGSKRFAEQIATKQLLEFIQSRQEAFLAGKPVDGEHHLEGHDFNQLAESDATSTVTQTKASQAETLQAPIELVTAALSIASHCLPDSRASARFRNPSEHKQPDQVFTQDLANLTMTIVREVAKAADAANIEFIDSNDDESPSA